MTTYSGRCMCGYVNYSITSEPVASRICWCKDCQFISGNGTANGVFPTESMTVSGELRHFDKTSDSGNTITRKFCGNCGCHLFSESSGRKGLTVVRLGTLENSENIHPTANIWTKSAPNWACMSNDLEKFSDQSTPVK